jgi:hypothetical protein
VKRTNQLNWRRNNYDGEEKDYGNNKLSSYATLLMPFWEMNPSVSQLFQQMLRSNDKRLKYNTAILLLRHKRPIPDTLLKHFAAQDEFRYELYTDLKEIKQPHLFPVAYNDHIDLAKSKLLNLNSYETPDTIAFIDKLPLHYKNRSGFVYFFKYRQKKDDNGWKIATAGLIPSHLGVYEFEKKSTVKEEYEYNFTELTTTKIDEEEPLKDQLQKVLKKMVYTKRKSGVQFYDEENKYSQFSSFFNFRD